MTTIEKKSLRVGKYVDSNHVDTLIRGYKQQRWSFNTERLGKEDTLSMFYYLDELEEFIQRAKQAGANGIRIHFGVYPENFERPEAAGRQTAVFVANKHHETGHGNDYTEKNVYVNTDNGPRLLAYNMSQGCPTYCGGRTPAGDDNDWGGIGVTIVDRGDEGLTIL